MMRVTKAVPPGILTEMVPGIRLLNDTHAAVGVELTVRDLPAIPPTDPGDLPSRAEYDQRCLALPGEQHVDECSCTNRATSSRLA